MKRLAVVTIFALCAAALAQEPSSQSKPGAERFTQTFRADAPNYSDTYCSGFISAEQFSRANHVTGGLTSPHSVRFAEREYIYLGGGGYTVGTAYSVLRQVQDPNKYEIFPGQVKAIEKLGGMYADIAHIRVIHMEGQSAVAQIEYACQPAAPGDIVVPFKERAVVTLRPRTTPFQIFQKFDGGTSGRVVMGRDFDQFLGIGQKAYVNIGASKGVRPGDYLRITRNYDPTELAPIDRISGEATAKEDTQKNPAKVPKSTVKNLPYHGIGEMVVLSVTDNTATGMITLALEDVQPGDVVEVQNQR